MKNDDGLILAFILLFDTSEGDRCGGIYVENMGKSQSVAAGIEEGVFSIIDIRDANGKAVAVWSN